MSKGSVLAGLATDLTSRSSAPRHATLLGTVAISLVVAYGLADHFFLTPRIGYVNTGKLMVGFSEATKVDRELKAEDDKWKLQLKVLQDSVQATISSMSKEYDRAAPARKKELQDMLAADNQRVNNFRQASMGRMEKLRQEKLQGVIDKVNVYMTEYGKKKRYGIVFGTVAGGSILYGDDRKYDITDDLVKGLNARYR